MPEPISLEEFNRRASTGPKKLELMIQAAKHYRAVDPVLAAHHLWRKRYGQDSTPGVLPEEEDQVIKQGSLKVKSKGLKRA